MISLRNVLELFTVIGIVVGGAWYVSGSITSTSTASRIEINNNISLAEGRLKNDIILAEGRLKDDINRLEVRLDEIIKDTKLTQKIEASK